jgi:hypothetical protein
LAAEARCGHGLSGHDDTTRSHKKINEKRKKALASMEDMIQRGENNAACHLYDTMIHSLEERATMRQEWMNRESDPIFHRMDQDYKPLPVPFIFECNNKNDSEIPSMRGKDSDQMTDHDDYGTSPMIGSPQGLKSLCRDLEKARDAYHSCK